MLENSQGYRTVERLSDLSEVSSSVLLISGSKMCRFVAIVDVTASPAFLGGSTIALKSALLVLCSKHFCPLDFAICPFSSELRRFRLSIRREVVS